MMSRVFWVFGAILFALSLVLFSLGGEDGGITDYRAWLLLASGIVAAVIGNVSRTIGHSQ
jgi:hypothetical protein